MGSLPTKLGLSSRTSDFAMRNPTKANQPIPQNFNVMGPNPLYLPPSYNSETDEINELDRAMEIDRNNETEIKTELKEEPMNVDTPDITHSMHSVENSEPSTSIAVNKPVRNSQNFESLLAAINSETASGK